MRFSRLSLERYGRFEDCELNFRAGSPDLHIIYGDNEAGKTTSLSAVSDLLFGFPTRSPYNFRFDYSLLRVGAVLEDGDRTLACRRKKGTSGTLLDDAGGPLDEATLASMLKGQNRETFGLSFSLDQDALRSGGRAMVDPKNDLGRALFAAGSGLTGIADELSALESEADGIWGPTAAQRRTFTQAQRQLTEATRAVRDEGLKPKAWSDARSAAERARLVLEAARQERERVHAELRTTDRVRRLAPLVRQREELLEELRSYEGIFDVGKQREEDAERLIREADEAQRQRSAADQLKTDAEERLAKVEADPAILARAEEVDQVVADAGASDKEARALLGFQADLAAAEALVRRLRAEAGVNADAAPARALAAKLRELARAHGEISAASRQILESRADLDERRRRLQERLDAVPTGAGSEALLDAVDAARALGADADARCDAAQRKAELAQSTIRDLLARLTPWRGEMSDLLALPKVSDGEIEVARDGLAAIETDIRRDEEQARRSGDEAAAAALEIQQLATGAAVSPEEIASAKRERDERWSPIRSHVLVDAHLPSPEDAVNRFEESLSLVDERMELRFIHADVSSRLSLLERNKGAHELQAAQAQERVAEARRRHDEARAAWTTRLASSGLPELEPSRFVTWQAEREAAETAHQRYLELRAEADGVLARRDSNRTALIGVLGVSHPGDELAPVLAAGERRRRSIEEAAQERRLAREQLDQIDSEAATLDRRQQRVDSDLQENVRAWREALGEVGLQMDVVTCAATLDLLDELREAVASEAGLRRRVEAITRDAAALDLRVDELAGAVGIDAGDTAIRLRKLRDRLAEARSAATLISSLEEEVRRRARESEEALAKLKAAEEALAPLAAATGASDRVELGAAIERSRERRRIADDLASAERRIVEAGDGLGLHDLLAAVAEADPDQIAQRASALDDRLKELNDAVDEAATAHGEARRAFAALDTGASSAVDAAADAEQARSELEVLAEHYILKRTQALTLKWAIEKYRERHQDPLLLRAGELFSILTTGRYVTLRVDADGPAPRLLGLRDDGRTMVEVTAMSEGTADQLFLALRLAALEQSVAAGTNLPFLADDLFVNFDDHRAEAGFKVLAEVAKSTQVLFFTHHPHLVAIAKEVVGADLHSECALI